MSPGGSELRALREIEPAGLEEVLTEATLAWERRLHWDFRGTADLIRNYVAMQALEGLALVERGRVTGYCYWVEEGPKTLLGDLFVREGFRDREREDLLLGGMVKVVRRRVRRVEAQLMQMECRAAALLREGPRPLVFPRLFMMRPCAGGEMESRRGGWMELEFGTWSMRWMEAAARLIAEVYAGHVDSEINDQYRTVGGSARFVQNIVQYPGCGEFVPRASFVARDGQGMMAGLTLATRVAARTGHIAQICVRGEWRGSGLAYEMLRRTVAGLREAGVEEVSLTVTEENERAVALYERSGFHPIHRFEALVWE
ncbi:MAG TPA: hypothetical protein DCY80_13690 [Solibacterales bacterium]|nr:hypothetical protein [Bryobacterales bacterium]